MKFDVNSGAFTAQYKIDTSIKAPTEIFLMEEIHYPDGYKLTLSIDNEKA